MQQKALDAGSVEGLWRLALLVVPPEHPEEVVPLLGLLDQCCGVGGPREVSLVGVLS